MKWSECESSHALQVPYFFFKIMFCVKRFKFYIQIFVLQLYVNSGDKIGKNNTINNLEFIGWLDVQTWTGGQLKGYTK